MQTAVGSLPGPVGVIAAVGAAVGVSLFAVGESFEAAFRKIRSGTGATEEEMGGLESSFKTILASGPSSMSAVADALTLVSQRTKLTGADLDALTETELKLARITGGDVKTVTDATTKALANFGIEGAAPSKAALEELLAVSQQTGIALPALASSVTGKAGASFRALGVDIGSAAAIMGTLEAAGVSTGPVIMSLSKAVTEAQKGGIDAKTALTGLFNTLKDGVPGTDAYSDAIKTLGSRGFQSLRDAVQTGKLSIDEFNGALGDNSAGLIDRVARENESIGTVLDTIKNKILVGLSGAGEAVAGFVKDGLLLIPPAMDAIGDVTANVLVPAFERLVDLIAPVWEELIGGVRAFVAAFIDGGDEVTSSGFAGWLEGLGVMARNVVDEIIGDWDALVAAFQAGDGDITSSGWAGWFEQAGLIARQAFDLIQQGWSELVSGFQGTGADGPIAELGAALRIVADFLRDNWKPIVAGAAAVLALLIAPIATITTGLIILYQRNETFRNGVRGVVEYIRDHWQPALEHARDALDDVGRFITDHVVPPLDILGGKIGEFAAFFIERWEKIRGSVETIVTGLVIAIAIPIGALVATVMYLWNNFGEQIVAVFTFAWDEVTSLLEFGVRVIGDLFDLVISILSGNWGDAWKDVVDIFSAAWQLVQDGVDNGIRFLLGFFISLPGNITTALGNLALTLVSAGLDLIGGLQQGIIDALLAWPELVLGWVGDIVGAFLSAFGISSPSTVFAEIGGYLIDGIVAGLEAALHLVWELVLGFPLRIIAALGDFASAFLSIGGDIVSGILSGLASLPGKVADFIKGLPGAIFGILGDIGGLFADIGSAIVDGITGAISGPDIEGSVAAGVGGALQGAHENLKRQMGISSPSKLYAEIGEALADGVSMGVMSRLSGVDDAFASLHSSLDINAKKMTGGGAETGGAGVLGAGFAALGGKHDDTNALLRELIEVVGRGGPPGAPGSGAVKPVAPQTSAIMAAGRAGQTAAAR